MSTDRHKDLRVLINNLLKLDEPIGSDAREEIKQQAGNMLHELSIEYTLDDLLDHYQVLAPGQWDNKDGPEGWYAVSDEDFGGITAYFQHEHEAFRWRMDRINRDLNG